MAALRRIPFDRAPIESGKPPGVRGGRSEIQESSVSTSVALPGDATNEVGSDAGVLSMTLRRVSAVVPCRAYTRPSIAAVKTTLETKQDIISGTCPEGQYVYEIDAETSTLVCRADLGAKGLIVSTVLKTEQIPAVSSAVDVLAECPAGSVPTGGSAQATPELQITEEGIVTNGYSATVANPTDAALTLNVTAICLGVAQ